MQSPTDARLPVRPRRICDLAVFEDSRWNALATAPAPVSHARSRLHLSHPHPGHTCGDYARGRCDSCARNAKIRRVHHVWTARVDCRMIEPRMRHWKPFPRPQTCRGASATPLADAFCCYRCLMLAAMTDHRAAKAARAVAPMNCGGDTEARLTPSYVAFLGFSQEPGVSAHSGTAARTLYRPRAGCFSTRHWDLRHPGCPPVSILPPAQQITA